MNETKTIIMTNLVIEETITLGDKRLQGVHEYGYLGHDVKINKNYQTGEIRKMVGLGWTADGRVGQRI